jgi:hypothetical protein
MIKIVCLIILMVSASFAEELSFKIANSPDIKGKHQEGKCLVFGNDLYEKLINNHVTAYLIVYQWRSDLYKCGGAHCFIVFEDEHEQLWAIDNMSTQPRRLKGKSPDSWCDEFSRWKVLNILLILPE